MEITNKSSIEEISKATGLSVEFVCESIEENGLEDILKTLEYHQKEAAKLEETVKKFLETNKEIEKVEAEPKEEEDILAEIGVTPETCPEIYGKDKVYIISPNVDADFGKDNLEAGRKLLDDILGEE